MDRGRVGTLAIGNKTIRDQMIAHQQEVHLERISKIKNRKPGSSSTMDNTPPVVIPALLVNPRKIAKKNEFNAMTEKENRVLLKRISQTLTAPPKITDEEYQKMQKLIGNMKGGKKAYEEAVFARHHKRYLDHLKTMGPYYDPNEWELDYKRQKVQQMFMREVPYERPKDYKTKELPAMQTLGTIHDKNDFKPHHTQLKTYTRNAPLDCGKSVKTAGQVNRVKQRKKRADIAGKHQQNSKESVPEEERDNDNEEERVELACTHRNISVNTVSDSGADETSTCWGEVTCYLINTDMLLICAKLQDEENDDNGDFSSHEAEAEIDIAAIASLRKLDGMRILESYQNGRPDALVALARFISESVDMKVEDDAPRIILNMFEEEDEEHVASQEAFFITEGSNDEDSQSQSQGHGHVKDLYNDLDLHEDSLGSEEVDAFKCSIQDVKCPVKTIGGKKKLPITDSILLTTDVSCAGDAITIVATVTEESATRFKSNAAVKVGESFTVTASLPSIMQADGELMQEYFGNLVKNLLIESHVMTGRNNMSVLE